MSVQFYGYNFGGTCVFHFFAFMHSFQKLVSDFGDFQTLYLEETVIEKALHANEGDMNRGIHCKSGTSCMGLAVNARLSISNEERQNIPQARC